jgi:hypothetical protein
VANTNGSYGVTTAVSFDVDLTKVTYPDLPGQAVGWLKSTFDSLDTITIPATAFTATLVKYDNVYPGTDLTASITSASMATFSTFSLGFDIPGFRMYIDLTGATRSLLLIPSDATIEISSP